MADEVDELANNGKLKIHNVLTRAWNDDQPQRLGNGMIWWRGFLIRRKRIDGETATERHMGDGRCVKQVFLENKNTSEEKGSLSQGALLLQAGTQVPSTCNRVWV